jgi:hypothetical protein
MCSLHEIQKINASSEDMSIRPSACLTPETTERISFKYGVRVLRYNLGNLISIRVGQIKLLLLLLLLLYTKLAS